MADNRELTKRQHYYMRAILKNFSVGEDLSIFYKDGSIECLTYEDKAFYGHIAWSDETETRYGAVIEKKGLGQIRHILNTRGVSAHQDISTYHIFWRLRHMYAVTPEPVTKIYEGFDSVRWKKSKTGPIGMGKSTSMGMAPLMARLRQLSGFKKGLIGTVKNMKEFFGQLGSQKTAD